MLHGMNQTDNRGLTDFELLSKYADSRWDQLDQHAFRWREDVPPPAAIPLEEKMKHCVWRGDSFDVIRLPPNAAWYQREGYDMQHCLQYLHVRYAEAAQQGGIILYSLIDRTGQPHVDIELAVTEGYGVRVQVDQPTLTQIRGFRNQCPPSDHYMTDLVRFITEYGIKGHGWNPICARPNFDGKYDGALVAQRWMELTATARVDSIPT